MSRRRGEGWRLASGGPSRSAALSVAVGFLAGLLASASGLHGCPRHAHSPAAQGADAGDPPAPAAGVAGHGAAGHGVPTGHPERDGDGPAGPCTCIASCHAGAPTALPAAPPAATAVQPAERRVAKWNITPVRVPQRPEFFLPYPLGPPSV